MRAGSILISGASIAGPSLAYWLNAAGWRTTVVERAGRLRAEGQNIDVRGAAREVLRRMGIEDEVLAANTGERGTRFVDEKGRVRAAFPASGNETGGATAEVEILRGELSRIVAGLTEGQTEYVFGDSITALREDGDGVLVTFAEGPERRFDVVALAEGMRSRTRGMIFGDEPQIRFLGMYTSYFTIPREAGDVDWWQWFGAVGGRNVGLRPDNTGTIRATLSFLSGPRGYEDLGVDEQKQVLRRVFRDAGWQAPRVLAAMEDVPIYFESIGQVRAPSWHRGRVALLGDAAYCASPISGMGTSLALVGAYILGGELTRADSPEEAFASYERIMRPYVDQAQKLPPGAPRLANPKSRLGLKVFHAAAALASTRVAGSVAAKLFTPPADRIALPDYGSHFPRS
ncbi:FAD-dependent monooxygenase [Winogradskya humida]|uniref:FAD-binding monooxygenase n=1 Tax=Winogradskya humida TaxID=113566 RepID=A0ABQ3ZX95_9ACTN|nr:FAD-dependent monooxygenase [Actinoplanes humidus]GIE23225.1 FAD-binding monooxygenase [Actinoplanes humidus]